MTMSRHFYSNMFQRYKAPQNYKNADSWGKFDVPHAVFMIGYNFGNGWSFGTEIEIEHGGTGGATEIEEEETAEYENEVEQGGEVVLEQFWINKSWNDLMNLKMGHIVVPVGFTNKYHLPVQYFGVFRPEGDATILPCAWHETGFSLWGKSDQWDYEIMFISGVDADRFSSNNWIAGGAGSPYEWKMATNYAGAFRVDNKSITNLTLGLSGYYGHSAKNTLKPYKYTDLKGAIMIGSFDFVYKPKNVIMRGGCVYGNLEDSNEITEGNLAVAGNTPAPKLNAQVAKNAVSVGLEAGYNIFSFCRKFEQKNEKLYVFGRYDFYDSMHGLVDGMYDKRYLKRNVITGGLNYSPIPELVFKAEYQSRMMNKPYNTENSVSIGITWAGFFTKNRGDL